MQTRQQLERVWNWLPAFRAVAESEHLPTAARSLGVTPPAVSRAIRNLEGALGHRLFARVGRRLRLNQAGRQFREALRRGMRHIHDGLGQLDAEPLGRDVRIAGSGLATLTCVLPAVFDLRRDVPAFVAHVDLLDITAIRDGLLRGRLDFAVLSLNIAHPQLTCTPIGEASNGVYCAPGHHLVGRDELSLEELARYPFTAPSPDARGHTNEGWPPHVPRQVVLHAAHMHVGAEACRIGGVLALLPDEIGRMHGLVRLPVEGLPPIPLLAVYLTAFAEERACEVLLTALRRAAAVAKTGSD